LAFEIDFAVLYSSVLTGVILDDAYHYTLNAQMESCVALVHCRSRRCEPRYFFLGSYFDWL